jgi:hypothetical protein
MIPYTIERELRAGEKILWKGEPAKGIRLQSSDVFNIPFSLFWGGFAFFWMFGATAATSKNHGDPIATVFPLFGLPFVAMGIYLIIGRFFVDAKIRANTEYAVTNERAIIASGLFSRKVKSLNLKSIPDVSVSEKSDGSGTITFAESSSPFGSWMGGRNSFPGMPNNQIPSFQMIPDVRRVSDIIQKSQRGDQQ